MKKIDPSIIYKINTNMAFLETKFLLRTGYSSFCLFISYRDDKERIINRQRQRCEFELNFRNGNFSYYTFNEYIIESIDSYATVIHNDETKLSELQHLLYQFYDGEMSFKFIIDIMRIQYEISK